MLLQSVAFRNHIFLTYTLQIHTLTPLAPLTPATPLSPFSPLGP